MKFSKEDVRKLADLARIELSEAEAERLGETLGGILGYVEKIDAVDTSNVETESDMEPVTRADRVDACDERSVSRILSQFPERENDYLRVPEVFAKRGEDEINETE